MILSGSLPICFARLSMTDIDRAIKAIRPPLRKVSPHTFWLSLGFGVFNILTGYFLFNSTILVTLQVVSIISLQAWALIFVIHGLLMLYSLFTNNWWLTRMLNLAGVGIKTAWLLEILAVTVIGRNPFLLLVFSLVLFFQLVNCRLWPKVHFNAS